MARGVYDLVLRWPRSAGGLRRLARLASFPVGKMPRHIDPNDGVVWIAAGPGLVAKFRTRGITGPRKVRLPSGTPIEQGYRLQVEPGSMAVLVRPIAMTDIPGGSRDPFAHPEGLRYLQRRPRRFVNLTDGKTRDPEVQPLELRTTEEWLAETKAAAKSTEGVRHPIEAQLVAAYADWRRQRAGRDVLVRHRMFPPDGSELLSDAFDTAKRVMLEAKASTDRPAIRMAIGQLLDYSRWGSKRAKLAILVPRMPSDDLIELAKSVGIDVVWKRQDGGFDDSAGGALTR